MVLLYISCVHGHSDAGPNFSIPASIKAQSKFDQVFWINTIDVIREEWKELPFYHNMKEFGNLNDYPIFSLIEIDLIIEEDFNPIKIMLKSEYEIDIAVLGKAKCVQEYTVTYEINE